MIIIGVTLGLQIQLIYIPFEIRSLKEKKSALGGWVHGQFQLKKLKILLLFSTLSPPGQYPCTRPIYRVDFSREAGKSIITVNRLSEYNLITSK